MKTLREVLAQLLGSAILAAGLGIGIYLALVKVASSPAAELRMAIAGITGKYGLVGELTAAARESRKTIDVIQKTSLAERRRIDEFGLASVQAVRDLDATIREAGDTAHAMRTDLDRLTASSEGALQPLSKALERISTLADTLDAQVRAGGQEARETAGNLDQALKDLDALIADPDIRRTLAGTADASRSLASSAESVDIALRPWRKKANQLKFVIEKALSMIRIVYAF